MRWKKIHKSNLLYIGDTRIIVKFLFRPYTIGDETRWLEMALIKRRWDGYKFNQFPCWTDIEFVN